MTAPAAPAVTRTEPLPVIVQDDITRIALLVGDHKVVEALAAPDGGWLWWNGGDRPPYAIDGGRDAAVGLVEHYRDEWVRRERSLWRPNHGEPDWQGYVRTTPGGVCCAGCGEPVSGLAATEFHADVTGTTRNYLCDNCACYLDDEGDD